MKKLLIVAFFVLFISFLYAEDKPDLSPMESYKGNFFIAGDLKDQVKVQISFNLVKKSPAFRQG